MSLEDLEKNLYRPGKNEREGIVHKNQEPKEVPEVSEEWRNEPLPDEEFFMQSQWKKVAEKFSERGLKNIFKWSLIIGSIIVIVVIGFLSYQVFNYSGISITSKLPDKILVGVPFDFDITYSNNSPSILGNSTLSVSLPSEFAFVGEEPSKRIYTETVGVVGLGTTGSKTIRLIALSGEQSLKSIPVTLSYGTAGLGTRFDKTIGQNVYIGDTAISLDFTAANKVLSNEVFEVHANYKNVSDIDARNLELQMNYPASFSYVTASVEPDQSNSVWELGDLHPGSSNDLTVRGSVIASANSFFEVGASIATTIEGHKYVIASKNATISISPSPLSASLLVNQSNDYIAQGGDYLSYAITYRNNVDVGFRDVVIKAKLTGEMFNYTTLNPTDNFNSITNTLTWNAANVADLAILQPGKSGNLTFKIQTKRDYPVSRLSDKNFALKVELEIESPTVPSYVAADRTVSVADLTTKVTGLTTVDAVGYFRDAASGIVNYGQVPLRVNQSTNYTLHWIVKNYSTDVTDVELHAFLKPNVRATGIIKSNAETQPVYNERTQELTWTIPKIIATKGVISEPIEAVVQIEVTPAIHQLGASIPLVGDTSLSAFDTYTSSTIQYLAPGVDSTLAGKDPTIRPQDAAVWPQGQ